MKRRTVSSAGRAGALFLALALAALVATSCSTTAAAWRPTAPQTVRLVLPQDGGMNWCEVFDALNAHRALRVSTLGYWVPKWNVEPGADARVRYGGVLRRVTAAELYRMPDKDMYGMKVWCDGCGPTLGGPVADVIFFPHARRDREGEVTFILGSRHGGGACRWGKQDRFFGTFLIEVK